MGPSTAVAEELLPLHCSTILSVNFHTVDTVAAAAAVLDTGCASIMYTCHNADHHQSQQTLPGCSRQFRSQTQESQVQRNHINNQL
jgi:hypothetical protein